MSSCPLCSRQQVALRLHAHERTYLECANCGLIFVPPAHHPDRETERRRYETHNNDPSDERYRAYLRRLADPLLGRLEVPAIGLDYGSGPGPTLSVMLQERGFEMEIFDPFFAPNADALSRSYDFITCTETAEHFHKPAAEFKRLDSLLKPHGQLALMTQWADDRDFARWSYARDVTHVCFYRLQTMEWLAEQYGYRLHVPRRNVALFQK